MKIVVAHFPKTRRRALQTLCAAVAGGMLAIGAVSAQDAFPAKPVHVFVPFAPGNTLDQALRQAAEAMSAETGAEVLAVQADGRRPEDCQRAVDTVVQRFGGIDILVNNDGAPPLGAALSFDDAAWLKAIEQNFFYVVRMVRASVPHMRPRGGGGILNITAISAIQPIAGFGSQLQRLAVERVRLRILLRPQCHPAQRTVEADLPRFIIQPPGEIERPVEALP